MREVLLRVRTLLAHRLAILVLLLLTTVAVALTRLPLLGLPGYELSAALSLVLGLTGAGLGALALGATPPTLRTVTIATFAGAALLALVAATAFIVSTVTTLALTPCDPFATVAFFPVLVLPSCLIAAAFGVALRTVTTRWWKGALAWLGLIVVSAVHTTWPIVFGPQVYAYNHLAGYLPGPLYDEELRLPGSLIWFRLGTLCLTALVVALAARHRRLAIVALLATLGIEANGVRFGFGPSDDALIAALGATRTSPHLTLHHDAGLSPAEVDRLVDDLEFRFDQITRFLALTPKGRVTVWWYRTPEEKQRLVGAAHTQFAKPWRREVHVNDLGWPHPVVKHELAHAVAGPLGAKPFGVPARWLGLYPHTGVIEGFAVAADNPVDELTLHAWAASMKREKLLPNVRELLEPLGFFSAPPSRAYTAAGSFIRWLSEHHSPEKARELYRDGDFERVYRRPLADLVTEWEAFLDGVDVNAEARNQAFARFKPGSIFDWPCAREVARLTQDAANVTANQPLIALAITRRCRAIQPDEPSHVLREVALRRRLGELVEASRELEALRPRVKEAAATLAEVDLLRLELGTFDDDARRALLESVLRLDASPAVDRSAHVRLASLSMPPAGRAAIAHYFEGVGNDESRLLELRDALASAPREPVLSYLIGRRLALAHDPRALSYLQVTLDTEGVAVSLRREAARLAIEAAFLLEKTTGCHTVRTLATDASLGAAFTARAVDWVDRCDFEQLTSAPGQRDAH